MTPFVLSFLHERSGGRTQEVNRELIVANARLAADVAVAASSLNEREELVDRERGQRLQLGAPAGAERHRDAGDRRRVGRLDHVDEIERPERRPLVHDPRAELLDVAIDLPSRSGSPSASERPARSGWTA